MNDFLTEPLTAQTVIKLLKNIGSGGDISVK